MRQIGEIVYDAISLHLTQLERFMCALYSAQNGIVVIIELPTVIHLTILYTALVKPIK